MIRDFRDLTAFPDKTNFDSDKLWFPSTACRLELYRLETVDWSAQSLEQGILINTWLGGIWIQKLRIVNIFSGCAPSRLVWFVSTFDNPSFWKIIMNVKG